MPQEFPEANRSGSASQFSNTQTESISLSKCQRKMPEAVHCIGCTFPPFGKRVVRFYEVRKGPTAGK